MDGRSALIRICRGAGSEAPLSPRHAGVRLPLPPPHARAPDDTFARTVLMPDRVPVIRGPAGDRPSLNHANFLASNYSRYVQIAACYT